jgi:lipopolysaccharide export system protein LptA
MVLLCQEPIRAQAPVNAFSGYNKDNANKPIDIESDKLEVDDKKHIAIFTGNVSATQGDYNLRSKRLEVTYDRAAPPQGSGASPTPAKSDPAQPVSGDDPLSSGQIRFIKAIGEVVVISSKDGERGTGDEALYDVKAQKITMTATTGKTVTLTQKDNVVRGEKLNIDLATGTAVVDPGKGRVMATFKRDGATASPLDVLSGKTKTKNGESANGKAKAAGTWQAKPN